MSYSLIGYMYMYTIYMDMDMYTVRCIHSNSDYFSGNKLFLSSAFPCIGWGRRSATLGYSEFISLMTVIKTIDLDMYCVDECIVSVYNTPAPLIPTMSCLT